MQLFEFVLQSAQLGAGDLNQPPRKLKHLRSDLHELHGGVGAFVTLARYRLAFRAETVSRGKVPGFTERED